jgi:hypothetical protein
MLTKYRKEQVTVAVGGLCIRPGVTQKHGIHAAGGSPGNCVIANNLNELGYCTVRSVH